MSRAFAHFATPPILFAAAYVGYIGHEGGLGLAISLILFGFIYLSSWAGERPDAFAVKSYRQFAHKATPQALVALMAFTAVPIMLLSDKALDQGTLIFLASALLYTLGNLCVSYQFARDFRPLALTPLTLLLVPQIWQVGGHIAAMLYNGGPTIYALPLVLLMVWLGIHPKIGRMAFPRSVPSYLGAIYNVWYIMCNIAGENTNIYMILSCSCCVAASCLLAQKARAGELLALSELADRLDSARAQEPPVDPILVEIPNFSFNPSPAARAYWHSGFQAVPVIAPLK